MLQNSEFTKPIFSFNYSENIAYSGINFAKLYRRAVFYGYKKKLLFTQGDVSKYSFIRLDFKKVAKIVTKNSLDFKNLLKINCFTHAENHINSLISSIHS